MDSPTLSPGSEPQRRSCTDPFRLCELREGELDKLGHVVEQVLWVGKNYAIYYTKQGVYVQFSDNDAEATEQRQRFIKICPELCELRYLTPQMRSAGHSIFGQRRHRDGSSLYDHNIAQAMMLVMEREVETGRNIAQQALRMAVERVANDNTIRYVRASVGFWLLIILLGGASLLVWPGILKPYVVAGIAGATGAMLSIAARLQSFRLKPCNQSNMNYWMSVIRVGVGVIAGVVLLLIAPTLLSGPMQQLTPQLENGPSWQSAAILGIIAGFAERLIPSIMRWTTEQLEPSFGTPSQAVRAEEMLTSKQAKPPADTEAQDMKAKGTSQTSRKITAPV